MSTPPTTGSVIPPLPDRAARRRAAIIARATQRKEVCRRYLLGEHPLQIAEELGISRSTVDLRRKEALDEMRRRARADMADRRGDQIGRLLEAIQFFRDEFAKSKGARIITTRQRMIPGPVDPTTQRPGPPVATEAVREETINEGGNEKILAELNKALAELSAVLGVKAPDRDGEGAALGAYNGPLVAVTVAQLGAPQAIQSALALRALASAGGNGTNGGGGHP